MSRYIDADLADKLLTEGYGIDEIPSADAAPVKHGGQPWHRVADGDLPAIYQTVLVAIKRTMKDGDDCIFTTVGKREPYTIDVATWNIQGLGFGDEIIAWTELPEYKE